MKADAPQTDPIVLRPASAADLPAIVALEVASFPNVGERFEPGHLRYLIHSPRLVITVGEQRGRLLGWAAGFAWLRGIVPWGRVYALAVDPHARGRNLGRQLAEHMIEVLERRGAARVFLEVRADNHAALRLYRKLGFEACRTLPNYYGPGIAAERMVRVTASSPAASP